LLEGLGVLGQDKIFRIIFIFLFGRMRMVKMVIECVVLEMPVNKMGISFQSCRMIASLMLVSVCNLIMVMLGFRMIMNERKQKERNNDPKKDRPPQSFIYSFCSF
jgi:hypothetical protein